LLSADVAAVAAGALLLGSGDSGSLRVVHRRLPLGPSLDQARFQLPQEDRVVGGSSEILAAKHPWQRPCATALPALGAALDEEVARSPSPVGPRLWPDADLEAALRGTNAEPAASPAYRAE
jgi:hypothetical protein